MQRKIFHLTTMALMATSSIFVMLPMGAAQASGTARFFCGRDLKGAPATMIEPANKSRQPAILIRWTSNYFSGAGYNPAVRCAIVSKKFQDAYTKNPNFVFTTTVANSEPVICSAERRGAACSTLLYTVKRGYQDPILTMLRLEQVRAGASGPLNESTGGSSAVGDPYVGVQDLIFNVFVDASNVVPASVTPKPTSIMPKATSAVKDSAPLSPQPVSGSPLW